MGDQFWKFHREFGSTATCKWFIRRRKIKFLSAKVTVHRDMWVW